MSSRSGGAKRGGASRAPGRIPPGPSAAYAHEVEARFDTAALRREDTLQEIAALKAEQTADLKSMLGPGSHVFIATTPETLGHVLDAGRFRSQFETASSSAYLSPAERAKAEHLLFGLSPDTNAVASQRPIYGYVSPDEAGVKGGMVTNYGTAFVRLSDDVRGRTTVTYGDSLTMALFRSGYPSPMNNPTWQSVDNFPDGNFRPPSSVAWRTSGMGGPTGRNYVEAQIHGGLSADKIASVTFLYPPDESIVARLRSRNIPFSVKNP